MEKQNVITVPWVFLSLGDHAPGGKRPIYYRDRGESGARIVGYAEQADVEILRAACEAYNDQRNHVLHIRHVTKEPQ